MADDLKPCPFCGGKPYLANRSMPGGAFVICTECRAATDDGMIEKVISKWNTRPAPTLAEALDVPEVKAMVGLLREARADLQAYVDAEWPENTRATYPSVERKWNRDMELCRRIDAALASIAPTGREGEG